MLEKDEVSSLVDQQVADVTDHNMVAFMCFKRRFQTCAGNLTRKAIWRFESLYSFEKRSHTMAR